MEKLSTKDRILRESMKLFAVHGFNAVSIRNIAAEVGVRDSALYKHFKSKQEIFDVIVEKSKQRFLEQYKKELCVKQEDFNLEEVCIDMFRFQTSDQWVVEFRQMLIIEQFSNKEIAKIYKQLFVEMPVNSTARIFENLIKQGIMKDGSAYVMSMELYAPFFMFHTIHTDNEELEEHFRVHVRNFIKNYFN